VCEVPATMGTSAFAPIKPVKMKKLAFILLLCLVASILPAQKMLLRKSDQQSPKRNKLHPFTTQLNQAKTNNIDRKSPSNNRLLVILVDFSLEITDDLNTTGNGKFALEADPAYLYSIGAPPHNKQYFESNLKAMGYYYQAVSAQTFNLIYDVWPKDKAAYTLPQPMGYYNPVGASSELFLSRMEEYFKSAFELADTDDPKIDFSTYTHYMIIHAGSDWQHDINGDTPSDIPSFYINVVAGKEAVVDNGTVLISHACNVPATISQDFTITESDGVNVHSGYGALNAVIAHEFGHSLGMVDLYDVYSYRPMVGMFDIMDSGGSGVLVDTLPGGDLVFVEGVLPTLPGAFSRNLMFGEQYLSKGLLKEFPDLEMFNPLAIKSVSAFQIGDNLVPHTYKIPLNEKEYILVENRNVDPDGDGGTAVFGDLDGRVVLYPTPFDDPSNPATWEYDYLLPSFIKSDGSAIGGGIMVWHVNESVIYDEGHSYSDGSWASNFDANTVNTDILRKGVSVIEADGLNDLGSDYSRYWTGTPYEYFHAKKPVLDINGSFVSWSIQDWKPALNSQTKPPLQDSFGLPGLFHLSQIGHPSANMSFKISSGFFQNIDVIDFDSSTLITAPIINSGFSETDLPAIHAGSIDLLSNVDGGWQNLMGTFADSLHQYDFPLIKTDNNGDGIFELVSVAGNTVRFIEFSNVDMAIHETWLYGGVTTVPLSLGNSVYTYSPAPVFQPMLCRIDNYEISQTALPVNDVLKLAGWDDKLVVLGSNSLCIHQANDISSFNAKRYNLPDVFGEIEPLIYKSTNPELVMIFVMSNSGNLYRIFNDTPELIFTNRSTAKPGQLGLTKLGNISPVIFFGLGNKLYALKSDGTLLNGFPYKAAHNISYQKSPLSLKLGEESTMYFPLNSFGYLAIDKNARLIPEQSLYYPTTDKADFLYYHQQLNKLYWYYPDAQGRLFIHSVSNITSNPILFNGYRNGGSGLFVSEFSDEGSAAAKPNAYIYPNPVKNTYFRLRLENYSGATKLNIYDISGSLVRSKTIQSSQNNPREIELDTIGLSSGVYLLSLENDGMHKRLKFAVEK